MTARQEKVREALVGKPKINRSSPEVAAALAEVEEWETRLARLENDTHLLARDNAIRLDRLKAAEAEADRLKAALETICEIGETRDVQVARAALAPAHREVSP